jgi:hypothetical protein
MTKICTIVPIALVSTVAVAAMILAISPHARIVANEAGVLRLSERAAVDPNSNRSADALMAQNNVLPVQKVHDMTFVFSDGD